MASTDQHHREILQNIAHRVMLERGLLPDFSREVIAELDRLNQPVKDGGSSMRDLRDLLWCSIDNDDSLDLDQLTVAAQVDGSQTKILVAIADVDGLVKNGTAIDGHASHNTTSVYTAAEIFPMLPEKLSTGLTSLNFDEDRLSIVVEMSVAADGTLQGSDVYPALVHNHAKLAYNSVAAWLEGNGPIPAAISAVPGLEENLRIQDRVAQSLKNYRHSHGALSLETIEPKPVFEGDTLYDLETEEKNRAKDIIEDFMIAANGVTARFLSSKKFPSIRRVVRTPKRWDRIVEIAAEHKYMLPENPDSKALEDFLRKEKIDDPLRFPDLSLSVIKLLGAGEYIAEVPGEPVPGHFGLAVRDYSHSTAPNRRFTDLITQRLLKAALGVGTMSYSINKLKELATHCTEIEDVVNKIERQVNKSAAALLLEHRIGDQFNAICTGASPKGTWVRLIKLPVEGRLTRGFEGVDVGDRLSVQLIFVDIDRGFIDFKKVANSHE